jgi:hypothetical protein
LLRSDTKKAILTGLFVAGLNDAAAAGAVVAAGAIVAAGAAGAAVAAGAGVAAVPQADNTKPAITRRVNRENKFFFMIRSMLLYILLLSDLS